MNVPYIKKLSLAIAAASALSGAVTPAISYDVTPAAVISMMGERLAEGDRDGLQAIVFRLESMGVTRFVFGDEEITLRQLAVMLLTDTPQNNARLMKLLNEARAGRVAFVVGKRMITATATFNAPDIFPTGSAG